MSNDSKKPEEIKLEEELNLSGDFSPPSYEEWRKVAEQHLKGVPFEKALVTRTYEEIDLQPIYRKEDIEGLPHLDEKPGFGNYVRGTSADGYLGRPWEICQAIKYNKPEDFNEALKQDLEKGQTAINLILDTTGKAGSGPENAKKGTVGQNGVSISTLDDLDAALKDIDLEKYPIHIEAGFAGKEMTAFLAALLEKRGMEPDKIKGSVDTDPLGFMAVHGDCPTSLKKTFENMAKTTTWAAKNMPHLKTIGISGLPYTGAGASAVQELAFVLATAVEYMDQLQAHGVSVDEIAGSMRFSLGIGPFFFMEIAKLRAGRMLWSKIIEAYGGNAESRKMTIHGITSPYNKTLYDPYVNMLRTTTESFSAIAGGVDSLQSSAFDEAYGLPDGFSRRVARNTQIVLKEESHMDQLIDPAGGSYYVEKLTHDVAEAAWALFQDIQAKGGMLKALQEGFPQEAVAAVAAKRKKDLAKRKSVMVGTNSFADVNEKNLESRIPDYNAFQEERVLFIKEYKNNIDAKEQTKIADNLAKLKDANAETLIPMAVAAVSAGAVLSDVFAADIENESESIKPLEIHRLTEIFEELRNAANAYETKTGAKPKLFLACMGPLRQYKARADFSKGFFEVGGFEVVYPQGFDTPEAAVTEAVNSKARVVVICSTDDTYPELVPPIVKGLKEKDKDIQVVLAGYPKDQVEAHKEAGVDEFIYMGADAHQILSTIFKKIGVLS